MRRHDCPELVDLPCALCLRAIDDAESDHYSPAGHDDGMADREADRYERNVLGL